MAKRSTHRAPGLRMLLPRAAARYDFKREVCGVHDHSLWEHPSGTPSEPFAAGEHKQIAVRLIDDFGNELPSVRKLEEAEEKKR